MALFLPAQPPKLIGQKGFFLPALLFPFTHPDRRWKLHVHGSQPDLPRVLIVQAQGNLIDGMRMRHDQIESILQRRRRRGRKSTVRLQVRRKALKPLIPLILQPRGRSLITTVQHHQGRRDFVEKNQLLSKSHKQLGMLVPKQRKGSVNCNTEVQRRWAASEPARTIITNTGTGTSVQITKQVVSIAAGDAFKCYAVMSGPL